MFNQGDDMSKSTELTRDTERKQVTSLNTPTDLKAEASRDISGAMNALLADVFALSPEDRLSQQSTETRSGAVRAARTGQRSASSLESVESGSAW